MSFRPSASPTDIDRLLAGAEEILLSQTHEGLQLARHARNQASAIAYLHGEVQAGLILGTAQILLGMHQEALLTLQQALEKAPKDSAEYSGLLEQMARCHFDLGDTLLAASIWQECSKIARENQHYASFIHAHIGLGQVHFGFEEFQEALQEHYKAMDYLHTCSSTTLRCRVYANIVMDLYSLERFTDAETMLQRTRDMSLSLRNFDTDAEVHRLTGILALKNGHTESAKSSFTAAFKISLLHENAWSKAMSLLWLGLCDLAAANWDDALTHLDFALSLATELNNPHLLCKIHLALSKTFEGQQELAAAEAHYTEYSQYRTTLQRPDHSSAMPA